VARDGSSRAVDATAADHLRVNVPVVPESALAGQARAAALSNPAEAYVYVIGQAGELVGLLAISTLLGLANHEPILAHLDPPPTAVLQSADQEQVAFAAIRHCLAAVPVADARGRFIGVVPASALLRVLQHEHVEDMDRLSGVLRRTEHVTHALDEPASRRVLDRLPWLLVGLAGSAVATWVMASFEASLERSVAVAFFIPGIVYLADAIGTQTEAAAVRSFSYQQPHALHMFFGELRTGFLLGLALAAPVLPAVGWIFNDYRLAAAVSAAILFAGTVATTVGFSFPLLLARCHRDPALGSGPLATVVQDVLSLIAYFLAVRWFLL
jgi:magnesium transporter